MFIYPPLAVIFTLDGAYTGVMHFILLLLPYLYSLLFAGAMIVPEVKASSPIDTISFEPKKFAPQV